LDKGPPVSLERPVTRQEQRRLTRRRIADAARQCFYEHGVAETSIDQIARVAGVGRATLYLHFANKDAILRELLAANMRGVRLIFRELCDAPLVDVAAARHWLSEYVAALKRHRDAMPLFHLGLASDADARALLREHRALVSTTLAERFPALATFDARDRARLALTLARIDQFASTAAEDDAAIDVEAGLDLVSEELAALLDDQPA
jgi:AcrR family transcriptional regulator